MTATDNNGDPFEIAIEVDPPYVAEVDVELLARVARQVLQHEGETGPLELGVWITNEEELRTLNRTYRDTDKSTDVLAFGADDEEEAPFITAPDEVAHLGDVAISFPHVVRQAAELGHSQDREIAFLLTHGILHLLGYDHQESEDAQTMREHEVAALGDLGIAPEAHYARYTS